MKYFEIDTLGDLENGDLCVLYTGIEGIGKAGSRLVVGRRIGEDLPPDATIRMSERSPGLTVSTLIGNTMSLLVLHRDAVGELTDKAKVGEVELLPFTLLNHRDRVASDAHLVVNPIGTVDSLDLERSDIVWKGGVPMSRPLMVNRVVLQGSLLADVPDLFRPTGDPSRYVISERAVESLRGNGFTNLRAYPIEVSDS